MFVANQYGRINGVEYAPGDPIEEPEKLPDIPAMLKARVIVLVTDPNAPKPRPKWVEPEKPVEPVKPIEVATVEEIETDDKKGARAKRK